MPDKRRSYSFPTRIEYGPGAARDLAFIIKDMGLKKGLLVTDKGMMNVGTPELLKGHFQDAGVDIVIFDDVKPNPVDDNVYDGTKMYKESGCDFIVALGGGSPIDAAKTMKVLATHDGPLEQYDDAKGGDKLIKNNMPPFFAVPTTAGTGSEVGRSSVITIKSTNKKTIIFSPFMMPTIAVLDPELTITLPPALTAATGVDAFVHNIEAYMIDTFHPFADGLAKEGMARTFKNLPIAVKDGNNISARGEMLMASAMGATAFQKGLGVNHSIAHALGVFYDMHHGLANAAVLIKVLKYNAGDKAVADRIAALGPLFDVDKNADAVIDAIETWVVSLGMPTDLKSVKIPADDVQKIEEYAQGDPCYPLNPRKLEIGDVAKIVSTLI